MRANIVIDDKLKTIDTIIAAWCIVNRCDLLHNDSDFDPFVKHLGPRAVST